MRARKPVRAIGRAFKHQKDVMNWKVTYKNKNGKPTEVCLEAANREALFKVLSQKNISAVRVEEIKFRQSGTRAPWRWGIAICAVVGMAIAIITYFIFSTHHKNPTDTNSDQVRQRKTRETYHYSITTNTALNPLASDVSEGNSQHSLTHEEVLAKPHWTLTEEERGIVDPSYPERHQQFLEAQAKIPWRTHVDRELALLLFAKDGNTGLLIPFDRKFADRFVESIKTPTLVTKEDSDELKAQKRELNEVKAYLKERMDAGEDIVKLLNDEYKRLKKLYGLRETLKRELREYVKTAESWEDVDEFVKAANVMLENAGSLELKLPIDIKIKKEHNNEY